MARFRKKPVEIEAVQWDGTNRVEVWSFILGRDVDPGAMACFNDSPIYIDTLEGQMRADKGDWIIKGVKGEFYPCKPDIFAASYDAV